MLGRRLASAIRSFSTEAEKSVATQVKDKKDPPLLPFLQSHTHPVVPYSKKKIMKRKSGPKPYLSLNDPALLPKYLRQAERVARRLGVADEVRAFNEAAAAYPNPPKTYIAILCERPHFVTPDMESWEVDFLEFSRLRRKQYEKPFTTELLSKWKGVDAKTIKAETRSATQILEEEMRSPEGLKAWNSRRTEADEINDHRSIDRAYTDRLVFVVKDAEGNWDFPKTELIENEGLIGTAELHIKKIFGAEYKKNNVFWFPGHAPIGHQLIQYNKAKRQRLGTFGERVFYYRCDFLSGRFRMPEPGERRQVDFTDFAWLTRDETKQYFEPKLYTYAHQIIGFGPGEEISRRKARLEELGVNGRLPDDIPDSVRPLLNMEKRPPFVKTGLPKMSIRVAATQALINLKSKPVGETPEAEILRQKKIAEALNYLTVLKEKTKAWDEETRISLLQPKFTADMAKVFLEVEHEVRTGKVIPDEDGV